MSRVQLHGGEQFSTREWLRRDVLWASLMTPYGKQLGGWIQPQGTQAQLLNIGWANITTAQAHHFGNVSRKHLYSQYSDAEAQSLSFFNQGKNIAGLISSAALFRACLSGYGEGGAVNVLRTQTKSVDLALRGEHVITLSNDTAAYGECERLATINAEQEDGAFGIKHRYLRAAKIMTGLAHTEVVLWAQSALSTEGSSAILTIHNGGHPRSGGDRVAMLQPLFNRIVASEEYQALTLS